MDIDCGGHSSTSSPHTSHVRHPELIVKEVSMGLLPELHAYTYQQVSFETECDLHLPMAVRPN